MTKFILNEFYRSTDGRVLRCLRGWDGQYHYTFRCDDGNYGVEHTDENGVTPYGMRMLPEIVDVTSLIARLEQERKV